jgi:hypothetical protein
LYNLTSKERLCMKGLWKAIQFTVHCKEIWIYVFPEKELRSLSPFFYIHVSVSVLYIPTFGPPFFLEQNWQTDQGNI